MQNIIINNYKFGNYIEYNNSLNIKIILNISIIHVTRNLEISFQPILNCSKKYRCIKAIKNGDIKIENDRIYIKQNTLKNKYIKI